MPLALVPGGKFDPNKHLRMLPKRKKVKGVNGAADRWEEVESPYLDAKWRLVWFRSEHTIEDKFALVQNIVSLDPQGCLAEARLIDKETGIVITNGFRYVACASFSDFIEKALTQATARCLALAGYGTEHAEELSDEDDGIIADAPSSTERPARAAVTAPVAPAQAATRPVPVKAAPPAPQAPPAAPEPAQDFPASTTAPVQAGAEVSTTALSRSQVDELDGARVFVGKPGEKVMAEWLKERGYATFKEFKARGAADWSAFKTFASSTFNGAGEPAK